MFLDRDCLVALVDYTILISHVFFLVWIAEFHVRSERRYGLFWAFHAPKLLRTPLVSSVLSTIFGAGDEKVLGPSISIASGDKPSKHCCDENTLLQVEEQDITCEQSDILSGIQKSDQSSICPAQEESSVQEYKRAIPADGVPGDATSTPTDIDPPATSEAGDLSPSPAAVSTTADKSETHLLKVLLPRRWPRNSKPEPVDAYIRTQPVQEKEDVALVSSLWDIYCRQIISKLKRAPSALSFQLVTVPSAVPYKGKEQSRDHICITGFDRWSRALRFHVIMAKKQNARLYHPLRLCYRLSSVDEAALSGVFTETPRKNTLCGTPLLVKAPNGHQWTCTIGGLIEVGNQRFGLTTKHRPPRAEDDGNESDTSDDVSSDSDWSFGYEDDDFGDPAGDSTGSTGGNPAVVYDDAEEDCTVQSSIETDSLICSSQETYAKDGNDWELIPVDLAQQLPNIIPAGEVGRHPTMERGTFIRDHVDMDSWKLRKPSVCSVTTILRGARLSKGRMRRDPSYLATPSQGVQQVWTVEFDGEGANLGDSGSWVVEDDSGQLFGIIVARAPGLGFVVPFDHIRQSIARSMDLNPQDVRLPSYEQAGTTYTRVVIRHPEEMPPEPQLTANPEVTTNQSRSNAVVEEPMALAGSIVASGLMTLFFYYCKVRVCSTPDILTRLALRHGLASFALAQLLYFYPSPPRGAKTVLVLAMVVCLELWWRLALYGFVKQLISEIRIRPSIGSTAAEIGFVVGMTSIILGAYMLIVLATRKLNPRSRQDNQYGNSPNN